MFDLRSPSSNPSASSPDANGEFAQWTPAMQWTLAVALGAFLLTLAYRGLQMSPLSRTPIPIQHDVAPLTPIDINVAGEEELKQVPGIGAVMARQIIEQRTMKGPIRRIDDLLQLRGFGPGTLEKAKPFLRTELYTEAPQPRVIRGARPEIPVQTKKKPPSTPIDINTATPEQLATLPGIGPTLTTRILEQRRLQPFGSVEELRKVKGIGVKTMDKIRPYVRVGSE